MGLREVQANLENLVQATFDGNSPVKLMFGGEFGRHVSDEVVLGQVLSGGIAGVNRDHHGHREPFYLRETISHEDVELDIIDGDTRETLQELVAGTTLIKPSHRTNAAIAAEMALDLRRVIRQFQDDPLEARWHYLEPRKREPAFAGEVRRTILQRTIVLGVAEGILSEEYGQVQVTENGLEGLPAGRLEVEPILDANPRRDNILVKRQEWVGKQMEKQERRRQRFMPPQYSLDAMTIPEEDIRLRFEWEARNNFPDSLEPEHERRLWRYIELVHGWRKFPRR